MNKESKIYVAGHLGLVGSALWKSLTQKGYRNLVGRSVQDLNLMDREAVARFFEAERPEYVFLAAAKVGGIIANNTYRGEFIYQNLMIQNNVVHQAYLSGVKKLLFLGSTCIYPREAPQPMKEECLLTGPLEYTNEPYAIAKIAGIKLCESYNLQYGTNFISVMPTNLYGPNDNFNLEKSHVLPALIRKIYLANCLEENRWEAVRSDLNKNPIEGVNGEADTTLILEKLAKYGVCSIPGKGMSVEIWGSGTPMREFLWSEEMADACVFIMENTDFSDLVKISLASLCDSPDTATDVPRDTSGGSEIRNTHINIGTGKEISIKELAFLIKKILGYQGELCFNAGKPDGTLRKMTDVSKLHALGWHHRIDIEEGIQKLFDWYRRQ